ncbi:Rv2993c-like domain-containing protein [Streptomyces sp. NPDC058718]|uniref:Rv2993c-like domain-containing protein n=1 Tax=Streptomyces sp. NPDC058718 TaxID=3346610 RepID=UPI0036AB63EC
MCQGLPTSRRRVAGDLHREPGLRASPGVPPRFLTATGRWLSRACPSADPVRGTAEPTGRRVPLHDVRLLAPVSPGEIVAAGRNCADHIAELSLDTPAAAGTAAPRPTREGPLLRRLAWAGALLVARGCQLPLRAGSRSGLAAGG